MDLSVRTKHDYRTDDQRWIGPGGIATLIDGGRSITLDRSVFVLATHYPNGFIPSGIALGRITATGLYAQYDDAAVDGRQVNRGHLLAGIKVDPAGAATADLGAALYWRGEVIKSFLPANHGLDAAGEVDRAGFIEYL